MLFSLIDFCSCVFLQSGALQSPGGDKRVQNIKQTVTNPKVASSPVFGHCAVRSACFYVQYIIIIQAVVTGQSCLHRKQLVFTYFDQ